MCVQNEDKVNEKTFTNQSEKSYTKKKLYWGQIFWTIPKPFPSPLLLMDMTEYRTKVIQTQFSLYTSKKRKKNLAKKIQPVNWILKKRNWLHVCSYSTINQTQIKLHRFKIKSVQNSNQRNIQSKKISKPCGVKNLNVFLCVFNIVPNPCVQPVGTFPDKFSRYIAFGRRQPLRNYWFRFAF